jgi:SulP family sulfate permease
MGEAKMSTAALSLEPGRGRVFAGEVLAGGVASVVLIANIVSFAALMFPGALAGGAATAIWAMLIGSGVIGLWVSWKTTLPPLATGMDSTTGAVLVLLATSAGPAMLASGGTPQQAVDAMMLLFSVATALSGLLLLALGLLRWGSFLRFVPHFVVAGFLGATGWLLIAGVVRMTTGHSDLGLWSGWTSPQIAKLCSAIGVMAVLLALRRWVRWPFALPAALATLALVGAAVLRALGLSNSAQGWYLPSLGVLTPWQPWAPHPEPLPWSAIIGWMPELIAVAIVALVALVAKTSSLEVTRKAACDLDVELRAHGLATLVAVPLGGIIASMQMGSSRLLDHAGGSTRWCGVVAAGVLLTAGLLSIDLPALIPLPIAAGLLLQLGWGFLVEAFAKPLAQRDPLTLTLSAVIMLACVHFGFLAGVVGGVVCACLLFAISYARLGAVRQQLSRAQFAGNVSRSAAASQVLSEGGNAIQIYWLSGYIFFGSSEGVYERVSRDIAALPPRSVRHVILDFRRVSAADASFTVSLAKLRNRCHAEGATVLFASLSARLLQALQREGFFRGPDAHAPFADVNAALAWAEDEVLDRAGLATGAGDANRASEDSDGDRAGFEAWLAQQLGPGVPVADFLAYLQRRSFEGGQVLYRQGEPADAIDLVVAGRLTVDVSTEDAQVMRLRGISTQTVVGEMGFFGRTVRSAHVCADGPATVWTLTRPAFERLRHERPEVAAAFCEFLVRTLSERIRLSESTARALLG